MITDADVANPPIARGAGDSDRVEITTVGIDVGSATFHLSFSRVRLERRAQELSTRFQIVGHEVLWSSPVAFTPYSAEGDTIDADAVAAAVRLSYTEAGIDPSVIDSGAVLLTGTALARHNARALAQRLAGDSGRFVCAAAGHHLEAILAAHGSGAVERSVAGPPVVTVDVGGGSTKLALAVAGQVTATAALAVGSRLVAWDPAARLTRIEPSLAGVAEALGVDLALGHPMPSGATDRICEELARAVVRQLLAGGQFPGVASATQPGAVASATQPADVPRANQAGADLLLTDPFPAPLPPFTIVMSGGVAEYLDEPEIAEGHGDLGPHLARALRDQLAAAHLEPMLRRPGQRIRATVIGAAQFSTQVSGSTIQIGNEDVLPLHDVPVVRPRLDLRAGVDARHVADAIRRAIAERPEALGPSRPVAIGVAWEGPPAHGRLRALADGIHAASRDALAGASPVVVAVDRDLAASLGRILVEEAGMHGHCLLCLDNLDVGDLDHIDIGPLSKPANVVPVVVKSLLFDPSSAAALKGSAHATF
ncbi:MAG TPA: ethanolamine ammonia-lyase reactivating factor EutA [Streptosporangiaceae bacterium]|nr:ethanolamine ammonia-lyase reactivating factor EutA [Streptosporangiaceae bacterium]